MVCRWRRSSSTPHVFSLSSAGDIQREPTIILLLLLLCTTIQLTVSHYYNSMVFVREKYIFLFSLSLKYIVLYTYKIPIVMAASDTQRLCTGRVHPKTCQPDNFTTSGWPYVVTTYIIILLPTTSSSSSQHWVGISVTTTSYSHGYT